MAISKPDSSPLKEWLAQPGNRMGIVSILKHFFATFSEGEGKEKKHTYKQRILKMCAG